MRSMEMMGTGDGRSKKEPASLGISRVVFLVMWVFALVFWVFADVRVVFRNADPNAPLFDGAPYLTLFTVGVWTLVICVMTLAIYLFFRRAAKR